MTQWEYLNVHVFESSWIDSQGRKGSLPTAKPQGADFDFPNTAVIANELGAEGWEVAIVATGQYVDAHSLLFKRPRG
jgi:hypothetical protein